jgi:cytochrome P450 PksS
MLRVDFTSQDYLRDPAAGLTKLRASGPAVEVRFPIVGKTWIITTNDLAGRVLKDSETFAMRTAELPVSAGGCQAGYAHLPSACSRLH